MARKILRVIPFESCEVSSIESWLNDMAASGLYLTDGGGRFASFERREAEYIRYAAEYIDVQGTKPCDEQLELYASTGWRFVTHMAGDLFIYSTTNSAAPPLHNDYTGLEKPMRQMKQKQTALAWVFLIMALLTRIGQPFKGGGIDYRELLQFGTVRLLLTLVLVIVLVALSVIHFRRASLAKRIIIRGELPQTKKDYRRRAVLAGVLLPLSVICAILWLVLALGRPGVHMYQRIGGESFPFPLVDEVFERDGELIASAKAAGYDPAYDNDCFVEHDLLVPEYIAVEQAVRVKPEGSDDESWPSETEFSYRVVYYEAASEKVAVKLTEDIRPLFTETGSYTETELSAAGADTLFLYTPLADEYGSAFIMRVGKLIAEVHYKGDNDISDAIPVFATYLSAAAS